MDSQSRTASFINSNSNRCISVYPNFQNRKPFFELPKTQNPNLTATPGFANPNDHADLLDLSLDSHLQGACRTKD